MFLTLLGSFIAGSIIDRFGIPCLTNYFYPTEQINIDNNNINKEFCFKCNKLTDKNFFHCNNCKTCHHEYSHKICSQCNQCIFHQEYNKHTKKECCTSFDN